MALLQKYFPAQRLIAVARCNKPRQLEREGVELTAGVDLRMARQDPLDESRTGARQAKDENRLARGEAAAEIPQQRATVEVGTDPIQHCQVGWEVIARAAALQRRRSLQVRERTLVLAEVLKLLGERIAHVHRAAPALHPTREQPLELCHVVRRGCLRTQR